MLWLIFDYCVIIERKTHTLTLITVTNLNACIVLKSKTLHKLNFFLMKVSGTHAWNVYQACASAAQSLDPSHGTRKEWINL